MYRDESNGPHERPRARAWDLAIAIAAEQWGAISRQQLLGAGASTATMRRLIRQGHLHRLYRGVYAVGQPQLEQRGRLWAAILWAGNGACLGGATALWWWGVLPFEPRDIHLLARKELPLAAGIQLLVRRLVAQPVLHRGVPVCSLERALVDSARQLPLPRLRKAVSDALYRKLTTVEAIESALGRGRPGAALVRECLEPHRESPTRTRSELEERFLLICERQHLPAPQVNARLAGFEVDFSWPDARLVVEVDGPGHSEVKQQDLDRRREMTLRRAGYSVVRYTARQLHQDPVAVAIDVHSNLVRGLANPSGRESPPNY